MMDYRDIIVCKQIMQTLRENKRVLECKIPKTNDSQTIGTLYSLILSDPGLSCFRVVASKDDEYVCIIRVEHAGSTTFATRTEKILQSTCQLSGKIHSKMFSGETSTTVKKFAVARGSLEILLKRQPSDCHSYIPRPVLVSRSICNTRTTPLPMVLCRKTIERWLWSNSKVGIIYKPLSCGSSSQIVHFILEACRVRSQNCRAIYVCQNTVPLHMMVRLVSEERHEMVGSTVGYKLSVNSNISDCTNVVFCTIEDLLLLFLGDSRQLDAELTHLIVGNVDRHTSGTDFLLSLLKEKLQFHPTLKLILITESLDVLDLARFFTQSSFLKDCVVYTDFPRESHGVEYIYLDSILTHMSTHSKILEMRNNLSLGHPLVVITEIQDRYGDNNHNYYLSCHMDALLKRCFYARHPREFRAMLQVLENHKHLVDYQHTESKLTLLMIAAAKGFPDLVQTLLHFGANPCLRGKSGMTALDWCDNSDPCRQLMVDACMVYYRLGKQPDTLGRLFHHLYQRIHNPYVVDHLLVLDIVMYIASKQTSGTILVTLPDFTDVLQCYEVLRESAPAKAKRIDFLVYHRYISEEEIQSPNFPSYREILVILMEGPLLEMLPSLTNVDYVIDTGLRRERLYNPVKEAYLSRVFYTTKHTVSSLKMLAKQGCFFLYLPEQVDSMMAYEKPNCNLSGLPLQVLQALLSREPSAPSVEMFFDSALTPPVSPNVSRSNEILTQMGAIEHPLRIPTSLGVLLAHLRCEVHHGKALLYSILFKCLDPVLTIVAALRLGNPFKESVDEESRVNIVRWKRAMCQRSYSDYLVLLRLYQKWNVCKMKQKDYVLKGKYKLKAGVMEAIHNVRIDLMTLLRALGLVGIGRMHNTDELNEHSAEWIRVKACLTAGFYPHLAKYDFEKRSFRDFCPSNAPIQLHPLTSINSEELPTAWIIYDHREDFMLELQDHSADDLPVHIVENAVISECMVMLMCDIDKYAVHNPAAETAESTSGGNSSLLFVPHSSVSRNGEKYRELLIGNRYTFQLTIESYLAMVWLREKIGRIFHQFTSDPLDTLRRKDVQMILAHVCNILEEEEKNVCPLILGSIGVRPKIKFRLPMGVFWSQQTLSEKPSNQCNQKQTV